MIIYKKKIPQIMRIVVIAALCSFLIVSSIYSQPVQIGHVKAELISEVNSIIPGQSFWVGLKLQMDPHWHVYWRNPGDAGIPPVIVWELPEGFEVGEINWPLPEFIKQPPLAAYGYYKEVLLPVKIIPPENLNPDQQIKLTAYAEWLVCKEKCIPGKGEFSITLQISEGNADYNNKWEKLFTDIRNNLPVSIPDWKVRATSNEKGYELTIDTPEWFSGSLDSISYYPYDKLVIDYSAEQIFTYSDSVYKLQLAKSRYQMKTIDTLRGILINQKGWRGDGSEQAMEINIPVNADTSEIAPIAISTNTDSISLWQALLFALIGGMILNLMPCVLPVLSIKILHFVQQASDEKRWSSLNHGLIFTVGVLVSFWLLAGLLIAFRAGGEQLGWGFQLQSPIFIIILSSFMFLFGLNLFGVFEFGTSFTSIGNVSKSRGGYFGSFLGGVMAVVVATPCTAPFMGSALGFTLTQPPLSSFLVFTALGLGLALPYVVISASPKLLRFVPKAGQWMETLKQIMGFLLMATVVWLVWVLSIQAGPNSVAFLLLGFVLLGVGGWIRGRWHHLNTSGIRKSIAQLFSITFIALGLTVGLYGMNFESLSLKIDENSEGLVWETFSQERVNQLRESGKPVFIDFTASWCLSCQVNEQIALNASNVVDKFKELKITTFKADWTSHDNKITTALAEYGRNSVPLYVLYGFGKNKTPIILPEILTPGLVLEALRKIEN